MKFAFRVTIEVEDTSDETSWGDEFQGYKATREQAHQYIQDAVQSWGGQFPPSDPFFRPTSVTVSKL